MFFMMIMLFVYDIVTNVKGGDGLAGLAYLGAVVGCILLVIASIIIYGIVVLIAFTKHPNLFLSE